MEDGRSFLRLSKVTCLSIEHELAGLEWADFRKKRIEVVLLE